MGNSGQFKKGQKVGIGRPKGKKNKIRNDVREIFHEVYEEVGHNRISDETGKPMTGKEAMIEWARDNPTEFYRLYGKMIPATAEITGEVHEDFLDDLLLEEEIKHIDVNVVDVGNEALPDPNNGADTPSNDDDNAPSIDNDVDLV